MGQIKSYNKGCAGVYRYGFNGKEKDQDGEWGNNTHLDYGARIYNPAIGRWLSVDPITKSYESAYASLANNPISFIDPDGRDTVNIHLNNKGIWDIEGVASAEGDDVFRITHGEKISEYTFSEGEYGERVNVLNLESTEDYTLGVFHVSGANYELGSVGFVTQPGGEGSTDIGSNKRLPEGSYSLSESPDGTKWVQPWVVLDDDGGEVSKRGVKWHPALTVSAHKWTKGCFVLSSSYTMSGCTPKYNPSESIKTSIWFDFNLGAKKIFTYQYGKYTRYGAEFGDGGISHQLNIKDGF